MVVFVESGVMSDAGLADNENFQLIREKLMTFR